MLFGLFARALKLVRPRRTVAMKNTEIVFPEKTAAERKKIVDDSYDCMIWTGLEVMAMQRDPSLVDRWNVGVTGMEHVEKAFARGKGIIAISAHIGNREHCAAWLSRECKGTGIARYSDSPVQRELIATLRGNLGTVTMGKEEPMMRVIKLLRHNCTTGIICDQHAGGEGIEVPFFGIPTGTVQGAAVFAYLTGAAIIPIYSLREAPFRLRILVEPEITWEKGANRDETVRDITLKINQNMERMIRANPGQWLWQHRRWREITP